MRILGIDPGYGITGFGLIDAQRGQFRLLRCGAITTPAGMDFSARLEIIYEDMRQLLQTAKPDAVAIEELFFGQNVTTGIGVAQSRGVILLAIRQAGLRLSYKNTVASVIPRTWIERQMAFFPRLVRFPHIRPFV